MRKHLLLMMLVLFLSIGCQQNLDLSQVRLILFQDAEGSMKLSHAVCPQCGELSVLDKGQFVPAEIEASCNNIFQYGSASLSKRLGVEASGEYCPRCGYSDGRFVPKILSFNDFFPDGLPREITLAKERCR